MTGADHYREAERLAREADVEDAPEWVTARAALAQVHATLALAAATALLGPVATSGYDDTDLDAWREAAGEQPKGGAS
ncbi:hypothetical protein [Streptosporangium roseum]|uniref:hypothetical protein n=1 Tax=Streptosporangium roseum TaxID=2001 RepID=UPI0004CCB762|nr:hypothetical protein [Streptosporangium roseum]